MNTFPLSEILEHENLKHLEPYFEKDAFIVKQLLNLKFTLLKKGLSAEDVHNLFLRLPIQLAKRTGYEDGITLAKIHLKICILEDKTPRDVTCYPCSTFSDLGIENSLKVWNPISRHFESFGTNDCIQPFIIEQSNGNQIIYLDYANSVLQSVPQELLKQFPTDPESNGIPLDALVAYVVPMLDFHFQQDFIEILCEMSKQNLNVPISVWKGFMQCFGDWSEIFENFRKVMETPFFMKPSSSERYDVPAKHFFFRLSSSEWKQGLFVAVVVDSQCRMTATKFPYHVGKGFQFSESYYPDLLSITENYPNIFRKPFLCIESKNRN